MTGEQPPLEPNPDRAFVRRVFIIVAVVALVASVWALSDVLLLFFGSILFAVILHAAAAPLVTHLRLHRFVALALIGALIVLVLAGSAFALGPIIATQMRVLVTTLPEAADRLTGHFQLGPVGNLIKEGTAASASVAWPRASLPGAQQPRVHWRRSCLCCSAASISRSTRASIATVL